MNKQLRDELIKRSQEEPFGRLLGFEVVTVAPGSSKVRMRVRPDFLNMFKALHGGAVFSLIDEAFQLACNTHGVLSVALNVSITYVASPGSDTILEARADEIYMTNRTASYICNVREIDSGKLIATAQALAYRTGKQINIS
ncbi:MAG: PaaI family thioesterase [Desulfomonile sp.]|jgi:acyl-CoA thioesterase